MRFGFPWSERGIRPEARETAKEAARRSGMSLGDWLNSVILQQAAVNSAPAPSRANGESAVHQRLDDLTHRIEQFTRSGPAAYAPRHGRNDFSRVSMAQPSPSIAPSIGPPMAASLDRAIAEITARQRALNGEPSLAQRAPMTAPTPSPILARMPAQDLSGLEDQLRKITDQIETLRRPGVEEAINALRAELGEIGRALTEAMPRHAIDAIEKQIQGLSQRIAEGRQAGVDAGALVGVEHGLAEVRDVLRGLTPAENLVGFNDAVAALAHKIDLIVAQKDPATLTELDHAITTLRDMVSHVASNETVGSLATQVQALAEKVEQISLSSVASEALNGLEHRIAALSDALEQRAQNGGTVPPMLESLVQSLSDKIELIQQSRGGNVALGHLEDHIVSLVQRLDASDSRLGHLEAIERGLADLLVNIEEMRANKDAGGLRAEGAPGVGGLKQDIARAQDALDAVHGTLGLVVDRLAVIESGIRGDAPPRSAIDPDTVEINQPFGKVGARVVSDPPPQAATAAPAPRAAPAPLAAPPPDAPPIPPPKRLPPAGQLPINPDLPGDQPLEPGSGVPRVNSNPAARIAASEAALGAARPAAAAASGKSGFIAAARRAAQAAGEAPGARAAQPEPIDFAAGETSSLRGKMMKRIKSLFIAASIVAVVIGSIQIAANVFDFGNSGTPNTKTAKGADPDIVATSDAAAPSIAPEASASLAANPLELPKLPGAPLFAPVSPPIGENNIATTPPLDLNPTAQSLPSLLNPPLLTTPMPEPTGDITGSISRPAGKAQPAQQQPASGAPDAQKVDRLPIAIGGARLRNAATAGDGAAAFEVAVRYAEGRGVPVNLEEAARWYERAAGKGLAPAQFRYASMLEKGQGVPKDLHQARRLYLAAAGRGNAKAMHNLAVLYAEGIDGKPDYGAAAQWFRRAAQHGIADSQYNLGVLCARGLGTGKNFAESYQWFALAAGQGDRDAGKKRDDVASQLDPGALAAAQQAVKSFVAEPQPEDANIVHAPPGGWDQATPAPRPRVTSRPAAVISADMFDLTDKNLGKR